MSNDEVVKLSKDEVSMIVHALVAIIEASGEVLEYDSLNLEVTEDRETARHLLSKISIHLIKQHNKNESESALPFTVASNPELN